MTMSEKRPPTDDGPNTARRRFSVRSLSEALAELDNAADHLAAASGMVARHRYGRPTLEEMARVEVAVDAVRRCLRIFTALAEHTKAGDTAYAAAVLGFGMTGQFPEEPGDSADGGESCS